jgi:hypothetical protein
MANAWNQDSRLLCITVHCSFVLKIHGHIASCLIFTVLYFKYNYYNGKYIFIVFSSIQHAILVPTNTAYLYTNWSHLCTVTVFINLPWRVRGLRFSEMKIMTHIVCCDIMQSGIWIEVFRRHLLLPSSGLNIFLEVIIERTASCGYSVSCPKMLQNNRLVDSDCVCVCLCL